MTEASFDPSKYAARLYGRMGEAFTYDDDFSGHGGWQPAPQDCHANVDYLVENVAGITAVRGWLVADYGDEIGFIAHSIVQDSAGKYINVTPPPRRLPWRYPFLKDDDAEYWQAEHYALSQIPQMLKCPAVGRSCDEIRRILKKIDTENRQLERGQS